MSNDLDISGPAFPVSFSQERDEDGFTFSRVYPGMTYRDWLVGQALAGCNINDWPNAEQGVKWIYTVVDVLLAARNSKD